MSFFSTPIEFLKGVGPSKADVLKKELKIFTYNDLLRHYPFRYIDRTRFYLISEITPDMPYIQVKGVLISKQVIGDARRKRLSAIFQDERGGTIELVWFQGVKFVEKTIVVGKEYIVFGKPNFFNNKPSLPHPELELVAEAKKEFQTALQPVYSSTEKLKAFFLDSRGIMRLQNNLLEQALPHITENMPSAVVERYKMLPRVHALAQIHFPTSPKLLQRAQARLKFEEFFFIQLRLLFNKKVNKRLHNGNVFSTVGNHFNGFYKDHLPFELTNAQKRVLKEIRLDTISGMQMNRLLQGDVGSGKTVVALMSMLLAIDNGFQACLMAPTEILATQHYNSIAQLLQHFDLEVGLLTGSTKIKQRRIIHEKLENGELKILIGTHALIEDKVKFNNLGLVIIDEQHRFGVEQRAKLWKKNVRPPHVLVMTATPIPRTLAMTLYGDLDVSVIDELPAGRKPIQTMHKFDSSRLRLFGFLKEEIAKGRQVYIVYPLIDESEKMDYKNLMDGFESISRAFPPPEYRLSIVHGKMKPADKDAEMERFKRGETQIMVATTVIEVGVNVPNASVMVIENAERFGLAQLHQLRGRVGRGAEQSYCILMSGNKLSSDGKIRLDAMVRTNDGFEISEMDLKLRGPGDLEGTQQSGVLDLHIADLAKDQAILAEARVCVEGLLADDPELMKPSNRTVRNYFEQRGVKTISLEKIS
ncbi:ATP-dependent DNA helicase RecG [Solitalea koreensis]|uniref:ATP-dependent DNA helicase RecG n=1 Tax=Solitalea koreensis TaxID=543615 RepID=A0A521CGZ5_9SPHI|nr:ATP-dependent DNA helicase RecG [Solitalea koreensis]SMO58713.1 ATP-dependent DNA helicase RecG [Solitalea koreensis]